MLMANRKSTVDTHKRKRNPNTTLKIVFQSQENKRRWPMNKNKSKPINKMAV